MGLKLVLNDSVVQSWPNAEKKSCKFLFFIPIVPLVDRKSLCSHHLKHHKLRAVFPEIIASSQWNTKAGISIAPRGHHSCSRKWRSWLNTVYFSDPKNLSPMKKKVRLLMLFLKQCKMKNNQKQLQYFKTK